MTAVSIVENIRQILMSFSLFTVIKSVLIAVIGYIVYRFAKKGIKAILERNKVQPKAQLLVLRIFCFMYVVAIAIIIISELGINASSLLVLLAVCLLVFVIAAEDILGNVASGIVMASSNPFKKGDVVVIDNMEGEVIDIRINCTKIQCYDGDVVTVPNKAIATSKIINYSTNPIRRDLVKFFVSYNEDPEKVIAACVEMVSNSEGVLQYPQPHAFISAYLDSNIEYSIFFWTKPNEHLLRKLEITTKLYTLFKQEHIEISYPQVKLVDNNVFSSKDNE